MKVACPKCGVTIVLLLLEFQNGQLVPCKFKCPKCTTPLEYHSDFAVREGRPEPRMLMDAAPASQDDRIQSNP
jgi:hypothetical protein